MQYDVSPCSVFLLECMGNSCSLWSCGCLKENTGKQLDTLIGTSLELFPRSSWAFSPHDPCPFLESSHALFGNSVELCQGERRWTKMLYFSCLFSFFFVSVVKHDLRWCWKAMGRSKWELRKTNCIKTKTVGIHIREGFKERWQQIVWKYPWWMAWHGMEWAVHGNEGEKVQIWSDNLAQDFDVVQCFTCEPKLYQTTSQVTSHAQRTLCLIFSSLYCKRKKRSEMDHCFSCIDNVVSFSFYCRIAFISWWHKEYLN